MYMLDTNICIFAIKGAKTEMYGHISRALGEKRAEGLCISSITLAELEFGVANSSSPEKNAVALMNILSVLEVMPFEESAAAEYGKIRAELQRTGRVIGSLDMLIAAHSKACGCILVTNNTREFKRVENLVVEDWFMDIATPQG
jgi:tRNA(fMet)-specific endonuclease VapC